MPIAAEAIAGGYEVAWKHGAANQFTVWTTDSSGAWTSFLVNTATGTDPSLESLEPSFQQDLNGDGTIGISLSAISAGAGGAIVNGTGTVNAHDPAKNLPGLNLSPNTSYALSGLSAPALTFVGTHEAIVLGSAGAEIDFTLQPSGGIATLSNFRFGTDIMNIDLAGAATSALKAFDTTVEGVHAIALASNSDLTHGIVLLNMTAAGETAANLLASHTIFSGGHAFVG